MPALVRLLVLVALVVAVSAAADRAYAGPGKAPAKPKSASADVIVLSAEAQWPGKILVNHDEWALSDLVYSDDAAHFARNIAAWFTDGTPGSFLVYSSNFGLTGRRLADTMRGDGHTWTISTTIDFSLSALLQYNGVFVAGDAADNAVLIDYVRAGGNVYLSAGTGWGGPVAEAARWNTFLNAFGLVLKPQYNLVALGQYMPIQSPSPLFRNVRRLWQFFGNSVEKLDPLHLDTEVLVTVDGNGLYATYGTHAIAVPVDIKPATCSSALNTDTRSVVHVAILGTDILDVRMIDPKSVRLFGVRPIKSSIMDVGTPVQPYIGRTQPTGCPIGADKRADLNLSFDSRALVQAIKAALGHDPRNGDVIAIVLTGTLKSEFGGQPILGEDLLTIQSTTR